METLARVEEIIRKTFRVPASEQIVRATTSADIAGWDSLSHASLIMDVEEAFGVELPFDRVYELQDVGALADLVDEVVRSR
jgi:acyl carrier protein